MYQPPLTWMVSPVRLRAGEFHNNGGAWPVLVSTRHTAMPISELEPAG